MEHDPKFLHLFYMSYIRVHIPVWQLKPKIVFPLSPLHVCQVGGGPSCILHANSAVYMPYKVQSSAGLISQAQIHLMKRIIMFLHLGYF